MKTAFALTVLRVAASAQAYGDGPTIDSGGWVKPSRPPETYDGLALVTALGPATPRRLIETGGKSHAFAVQRVRIDDSRANARGTVVEVYFDYGPIGDLDNYLPQWPQGAVMRPGALPVGARVLLVAAKPHERGFLRVPQGNGDERFPEPPAERYPLGSDAPPSMFAFGFFRTAQTALAAEADPMWRYVASIAECLRGASDADAAHVAAFVRSVRLPNWQQPIGVWHGDDRLSALFVRTVAKDSAYRRAQIDLALNALGYVGYADRFYRDLYAAAGEPGAFPEGVDEPSRWEQPTNAELGVPSDFKHDDPPTPEQRMAVLKGAKSPTVAAWMLGKTAKPADADARDLARFLDSPDPRLRYAFVQRLAAWYGGPAPAAPQGTMASGGASRLEYPGLDAQVAAWKAKLRALPAKP